MKIRCPYCGSRNTARILYGLPAFSEELNREMENGKVVPGGCDISGNKPEYQCKDCSKKFGKAPVFSVRGRKYTPDDLAGIEFEDGGFFGGYHTVSILRNESSYELSVQHSYGAYDPYVRGFQKREWDSLKKTLFDHLFVHEWKRSYVDWSILDGEQWSLELTFSDGRHRRIYGSNAYPALWDSLQRRFGRYIREARGDREEPGE